jgi:hypothetical protein
MANIDITALWGKAEGPTKLGLRPQISCFGLLLLFALFIF